MRGRDKSVIALFFFSHCRLLCFVSRRPLSTPAKTEAPLFVLSSPWNDENNGKLTAVDIIPGIVAVGTEKGGIKIFTYGGGRHILRPYLRISSPPSNDMSVVSCKLSGGIEKVSVFVAYRRRQANGTSGVVSSPRSTAGISCFDMPVPRGTNPSPLSAPSARHDLDGRIVTSPSLCDAVAIDKNETLFTVARPDGLYTYSTTQKVDVSSIDGPKLAICLIPPPKPAEGRRIPSPGKSGSSFALVASTDVKSRRDAVDIYDATNKLVAFHLLLSPGHTTVRVGGVTTRPVQNADGNGRVGRSSAIVFTSGGSLVTLTEKGTAEKVNLLVQKNLYSAAIFVAYSDPSFDTDDITMLYRRHAEYLYRKGDYSGAIDQYKHTIGSLEPSHVIFRYLDAPKIPLLVKYLEELRSKNLTTLVHNELLRTCYLKLNDSQSAEAIAAFTSRSTDADSLSTMVANAPKDALATICSFDAAQAAEALALYGASLARLLPRETAGLVVTLCLGTFAPTALSESANTVLADAKKFLEQPSDVNEMAHEPYPVYVFASCFVENPKMLRLILTHCNRNKCPLTPSLRRTLLELTLSEWNQAKRTGDTEAEKLRRKEAIASLTDSHCREIGDYDALVIVQLAGFEEGELLLYERLQMGPMLLSRYAKDGSDKARRQMLAMCQSDPEILADVLGYFVSMVTERLTNAETEGDEDESDDVDDILEDIQDALALARRQGVLPPVRIARILAGEGTGQFSSAGRGTDRPHINTVPLSVALDYVGNILDESRKEISRLKTEVEEYNQLCNSMEMEIDSLLKAAQTVPSRKEASEEISPLINVEKMYTKVRVANDDIEKQDNMADTSREAFWREMDQTEDSFQIIARFFTKGVIQ
jgi:vacuolar protein sorting-associated protein 11